MTSEELNKRADQDAKEFFAWLRGYIDGIGARDVTSSDVYQVSNYSDRLIHAWREWSRS